MDTDSWPTKKERKKNTHSLQRVTLHLQVLRFYEWSSGGFHSSAI
jgi:hypothetical protein